MCTVVHRIVLVSMVGLLAACASMQEKERPVAEARQKSESERFRDQAEYAQEQVRRDEIARVNRVQTWKNTSRPRTCTQDSNGGQVCSGGSP